MSAPDVFSMVGAVARLSIRTSRGLDVFEANVTWAEQREGFVYFGFAPIEARNHGRFGAARLYPSPRPFGLQDVEFVRRPAPVPRPAGNGWMVGHPGFDPVH